MDGKPVPLYGDGGNVRSWVHVDDHCRGVHLVLDKGARGRVCHVSGDTELTNKELTAAILEACGAAWDMVVPVADRQGHDRRYSLDDTLLRSMGYTPCPVHGGPAGHRRVVRGQSRLVGAARPPRSAEAGPVTGLAHGDLDITDAASAGPAA
jgi:nucleoside-diphosphate-sugar epimerase